MIRLLNHNLANEIFLRIKEGEVEFEEIASKYSEGPEKKYSGSVGPISIGKLHPIIGKILISF